MAGSFQEYQVKAAFIYNFIKFIDWQNQKDFKDFNICILGEDPFGKAIDILEGKKVRGWRIKISRTNSVKATKECQVVFISSSERDSLKEVLSFFRGKPVLTISEVNGFIEQGGIINFIIVNDKIRFEINERVAKESGLKISSKLLRLARKVIR
jgi:hypothetical protein